MQWVVIDYESYWDHEYSLTHMTTAEYICDRRFEAFGAAIKIDGGQSFWVDGPELSSFFAGLDPNDTALISHNALFDASITSWVYGFRPRLWCDTLAMSRAVLGHLLKRHSLAKIAEHLGIGVKGDAIQKTKGMRRQEIMLAGMWPAFVDYGLNDADLCWEIFQKLLYELPLQELAWIDLITRMMTEPVLQVDGTLVAKHLNEVRERKANLLMRCNLADDSQLQSNQKFAELLKLHGVEPPIKTSGTTGKLTYAFAKSDPAFLELLEHPDVDVQMLVEARLGHKSTLEETRAERFLKISNLVMPNGNVSMMPVPLNVSRAHTHRLGGGDKLNLQNLPRGGKLRYSLKAPPGYKVMTVDARQIEARLLAWFARQNDLVEDFERGKDIYSSFASHVFGRPIDRKVDILEGFIGKTAILGLGYSMGAKKFIATVASLSQNQLGHKIEIKENNAQDIVNAYRNRYAMIRNLWTLCEQEILPALAAGVDHTFGCLAITDHSIVLPDGMRLFYHGLKHEIDPYSFYPEWTFRRAGDQIKTFGGKITENIIQALAFVLVKAAMLKIRMRFTREGIQGWLCMQAHDEAVALVREDHVGHAGVIMLEEMRRRPPWAEKLPLDAELSDPQDNYGACK